METTHVTATLAASVGELTGIMHACAKWARRSLALNKHRAKCRVPTNQMKTMKKKSLTNGDDSVGDEETETDDEAAKAQPGKGTGKAQHSGPVRRSSRLSN